MNNREVCIWMEFFSLYTKGLFCAILFCSLLPLAEVHLFLFYAFHFWLNALWPIYFHLFKPFSYENIIFDLHPFQEQNWDLKLSLDVYLKLM